MGESSATATLRQCLARPHARSCDGILLGLPSRGLIHLCCPPPSFPMAQAPMEVASASPATRMSTRQVYASAIGWRRCMAKRHRGAETRSWCVNNCSFRLANEARTLRFSLVCVVMQEFMKASEKERLAAATKPPAPPQMPIEPKKDVEGHLFFSHGREFGQSYAASMHQLHFTDPARRECAAHSCPLPMPRASLSNECPCAHQPAVSYLCGGCLPATRLQPPTVSRAMCVSVQSRPNQVARQGDDVVLLWLEAH